MGYELLLLSGLIFVFIVSFCGLLQKIKQSYERERLIAERLARRQQSATTADSLSDVYLNSGYVGDCENGTGIFPGPPPPYAFVCPPPKYDDVVKTEVPSEIIITTPSDRQQTASETTTLPPPPPAYTISS